MLGQSIVLNNGKRFGLPSLKQLRKLQLYSKKFFYRLLATISNISTAVMGIFAWLRVRECGRENEYFVMLGYNITLSSRGLQYVGLVFFALRALFALYNVATLAILPFLKRDAVAN
ncbi:hypothetical protein FRC12_025095 [Ceratobasidium sp. 428]|nr:hypothetical protein FRC12_025095 [Ceratobasidium sp. 428]